MALYGIKDNKCLQPIVETVTVITSKPVNSSNIASNVLRGEYPEGFTKNNCIPISIGGARGSSGDITFFGYWSANYNEKYRVYLTDNGIYASRYGESSDDVENASVSLTIYLMRYTD